MNTQFVFKYRAKAVLNLGMRPRRLFPLSFRQPCKPLTEKKSIDVSRKNHRDADAMATPLSLDMKFCSEWQQGPCPIAPLKFLGLAIPIQANGASGQNYNNPDNSRNRCFHKTIPKWMEIVKPMLQNSIGVQGFNYKDPQTLWILPAVKLLSAMVEIRKMKRTIFLHVIITSRQHRNSMRWKVNALYIVWTISPCQVTKQAIREKDHGPIINFWHISIMDPERSSNRRILI